MTDEPKPAPKPGKEPPPPGDPSQSSDDRVNPFGHPFKAAAGRRARKRKKQFVSDIDDLERADQSFDLGLKQRVAGFALWAVGVQIAMADAVFGVYVGYEIYSGREISVAAINAWLGAGVVQIIGILFIIARYLFPRRGARINRRARSDRSSRADQSQKTSEDRH